MRDVHDARQRAALLAGDDVLTTQYKEMVDGGVVTEEVGNACLGAVRFASTVVAFRACVLRIV